MNIWSYWEGPKPQWILDCQESLVRHGGDYVKILNWEDFDKLWEYERSLPITSLYVAQKADFIRSYLLRYLGGMWIDADCLIMRNLTPIIKSCEFWDFIFYRQKDGAFSNAFIGAKKESKTAKHFYDGVVWQLNQGKELGWTDLGQSKLWEAVHNANSNCLQLATELISPYDWSEGAVFLSNGDCEENKIKEHPRSLAYMISNHSVGGARDEIISAFNEPNSLFSYLVQKSVDNKFT